MNTAQVPKAVTARMMPSPTGQKMKRIWKSVIEGDKLDHECQETCIDFMGASVARLSVLLSVPRMMRVVPRGGLELELHKRVCCPLQRYIRQTLYCYPRRNPCNLP